MAWSLSKFPTTCEERCSQRRGRRESILRSNLGYGEQDGDQEAPHNGCVDVLSADGKGEGEMDGWMDAESIVGIVGLDSRKRKRC